MGDSIMKKFMKIITIILVVALCLFTPGTPAAVNSLLKLTPAETTSTTLYNFTAPQQNSSVFDAEPVETYDLANWTSPSSNYLVSQHVTAENNASFHEEYPYTTLSNANIINHSPYVITTNTLNMPARDCYTTNAITLPANGYYIVRVEYCLQEQVDENGNSNNTTNTNAFGTFYLKYDFNGSTYKRAISLQNSGWSSATFYIQTDLLETASITPELYFGSDEENALGAIYFDKFTVTAINQDKFTAAVFNGNNLKVEAKTYLNFSQVNREYVAINGDFSNSKFVGNTNSYATSLNAIETSNVPEYLGFSDEQTTFYPQKGNNSSVMLMQANDSNATLTLKNYTLKTQPHEVYMFQFYSIATAEETFEGFYLTLTPSEGNSIAEQITNLSSYPYHNGWQLNTVFLIAGRTEQDYTLGFSLANGNNKTTGWACIDDLKIYKVNGSYATDNATATGVHDTNDLNSSSETLDIANGYFELGTTADTVTDTNSTYPYPLKANDWITNNDDNGIVNLAPTLWHENFGANIEHPGMLGNANNNVYMMHNTSKTTNTLTSPAISTTAGETTYISFDAYSKNATHTTACIISASTDDDGNLTDLIYLCDPIRINAGEWQHYEFSIQEDACAVSRSYYLQFTMDDVGYAFIDNVRKEQFGTADETGVVDLNNPVTINGIWQATNTTLAPYIHATKDGLTIENTNGQKTTVQNNFAYNFTADKYYEIIVTARGNNARLGLKDYDGLITVTTDKLDATLTYNYKLYVKATESTTTNLQITLGALDDDSIVANGNIFIDQIKINTIEETDYNDAKELASDNSRMLVLSQSTTDEDDNDSDSNSDGDNSFFGENWWYLIPTLITALALLIALVTFLFRRIKFDKHITKKNTSYARDMQLKNQRNKIVAQKATKVDNVTDETKGN